ncbi:MAG: hypothetical protein U0326_00870 [Polyangiales bacterium]
MSGIWNNRFEVVLRPLRDPHGAQHSVVIETRTAAKATREVTARFPDMKVVSVTRITPTVASLKAAQRAESVEQPEAAPQTPAATPIRRVS